MGSEPLPRPHSVPRSPGVAARPPRRLAARLAAVALAGALIAACSGGGAAEVATVGDAVVTEADIAALYEARAIPVGEELRGSLYRLIAREVLLDAMAAEFGIGIDEDEVEAVYQGMIDELDRLGVTPAEALQIPNAGRGMVRFNAELSVIRDTVTGELVSAPEYLDALFEEGVSVTTVCVHHVLVETSDEALEAMARIEAGEDVEDLAEELSADPTPGGDLGCRLASAYVTQFARATLAAEIGEPHGPVETEFGWHVLVVAERTTLDRAEVERDPTSLSSVDLSFVWSQWVNDRLRDAEVQVVERYGTWSATGIRPPANG